MWAVVRSYPAYNSTSARNCITVGCRGSQFKRCSLKLRRESDVRTHLCGEHSLPAQGYRHFASGAAGRAPAPARAAPSTDPPLRARPPPVLVPSLSQTIRKTLSPNFPNATQISTSQVQIQHTSHYHSSIFSDTAEKITIPIRIRLRKKRRCDRDTRVTPAPIGASVRLARRRPRIARPAPSHSGPCAYGRSSGYRLGLQPPSSAGPADHMDTCGGRSAVIERAYTCALRRTTVVVAHSFVRVSPRLIHTWANIMETDDNRFVVSTMKYYSCSKTQQLNTKSNEFGSASRRYFLNNVNSHRSVRIANPLIT